MPLIALTDDELRAGRGLKWGRAPDGVIPADVAELDFAVAPPIRAVLSAAVDRSGFGYPDYTGGAPVRLAEVFAERTRRLAGWSPDPGRVEVCAQVAQALCCAVLAFTRPGDEVLVHSPTYPPFLEAIRSLGRRALLLPVGEAGGDGWAAVESAARLRLVVLCQPHNPTGRVFGRAELERLADLAVRRNAVVFADEIHAEIVYPESEFLSIASVRNAAERTIVFTSAAKSFNVAGLRCAVGHFGSDELRIRFQRLPWHLRSGASVLGIAATITAWEACDDWLDQLKAQLAINRTRVTEFMSDFAQIRYTQPSATYLCWMDLGTVLGSGAHHLLAKSAKISLQPGSVFGASLESFVRFNFGTSEARLDSLLERFGRALESCGGKG
ncbi:aminotransferase class I/II-fold pyridoxal phosphate-dependent enzyme [Streptomyces niveiscabiei]|uniref:MalY/PatB family protein n=1 Tax=Streptomyces niveiscabiei TaxID=164115 RepID=UPI0029BC0F43|nr:aminotransferase class I/II-fold pyridoxal phosphate-dependent enzyme [Streptomyces niveiscabiei]MDX3383864.1 aminotransferase class I/II-fold pyridoxal phosphate-dependent enzyme [Streptomyces niveiscabiei]